MAGASGRSVTGGSSRSRRVRMPTGRGFAQEVCLGSGTEYREDAKTRNLAREGRRAKTLKTRGASSILVRGRRWTPLGMALLCGHCALSGVLAVVGLAGAGAAPVLLGVNVNYVWPPVLLRGLFAFLVWGPRRDEDAACTLPQDAARR